MNVNEQLHELVDELDDEETSRKLRSFIDQLDDETARDAFAHAGHSPRDPRAVRYAASTKPKHVGSVRDWC